MSYILQGFGVFFGVISGVVINLLVQYVIEKNREKKKIKNMKFELRLDIKKIDAWIDELSKYRNALNSETLYMYFGYFDLSRFTMVTTNDLFISGVLYKYLKYEYIEKLQIIASELSLVGENYINNQINQNKITFNETMSANGNLFMVKERIINDINFWENKFKAHKKSLEEIIENI